MVKALPWILSFLLHAAFAIVPLRLAIPVKTEGAREPRVEIALVAESGSRSGFPRDSVRGIPLGESRVAGMVPLRNPEGRIPPVLPQPDIRDLWPGSPARPLSAPRGGADEGGGLFPGPQDVLADVPADAPDNDGHALERIPSPGRLESAERPSPPPERIGWEGQRRKLIRRQDPAFPSALGASGQEVECEARIAVAPNGTVVHVEITKSSGYTEVDASVESALRAYLFSRGDTTKEAVGTIRFRFRLEKRD